MTFIKDDVGDKKVSGRTVQLSDTEKQAIADEWNTNELTTIRQLLRETFIAEGVSRIAAQVSAWDSYERIEIIASVWNLFGGAPSAAQTLAKDTYLYVRDTAIPKLATLDIAALGSINVTAAKPFLAADPTDLGWPT